MIIEMYMQLLRRLLNLSLPISQGIVLEYILSELALYAVLLSVYSRTRLSIFIDIGLYVTDTEPQNSLQVF